MRIFRITLYTLLSIVALLVVAIIGIPMFFKSDILELASKEISNQIEADVTIGDVDISLLRDFPNLNVSLENLSVVGKAPFEGIPLASIEKISVSIDSKLAITSKGENIKVTSFEVIQPKFQIRVNKQGQANYDVAKQEKDSDDKKEKDPEKLDTTSTKAFKLDIDHYLIENLSIDYEDLKGQLALNIENFTHGGKVSVSESGLAVQTKTTIQAVTASQKNVNYLNRTPFDLVLDVALQDENGSKKFNLSKTEIKLGNLALQAQGKGILKENGTVQTQIKITTPNTDFRSLLHLLPDLYKKQIKDLKVRGSFGIRASINGLLDAKNKIYPKLSFSLKIKNGFIQYPSLPESIQDINMDLLTQFPGGKDLDKLTVNLRTFRLSIAKNPIALSLFAGNLISDPTVRADANISIALASLKKALPLKDLKKLKGSIRTKLHIKGKLSYLKKKQYNKFEARGETVLKGIQVESSKIPYPLSLDIAQFKLSPKAIILSKLDCKIDKSKLHLDGKIQNYLTYVMGKGKLSGTLNISSPFLDLDRFVPKEKTQKKDTRKKDKKAMIKGKSEPLKLPKDIVFQTRIRFKKVKLSGITIQNISGELGLRNQAAYLKKINVDIFKGRITADGSFSTKKKLPKGIFDLKVKNIDIHQAATEVEMIRKINEITTKAYGKVSSKMSITLDLTPELKPLMPSINSKGNLTTKNIELRDVEALQEVGKKLNIAALQKDTKIQNLDINFTIKDGTLTLKPFIVKIDQAKMNISGTTKITPPNDMNIKNSMILPRAYLGSEVNRSVDQAVSFAKKNGIDLSVDKNIAITLRISGTAKKPEYSFLYGKDGSASLSEYMSAEAKRMMKSAEKKVTDKAKKSLKNEVEKEAKNLLKKFF